MFSAEPAGRRAQGASLVNRNDRAVVGQMAATRVSAVLLEPHELF